MEQNSFYAMLSRMKYINRWGLMRNTRNENICEHSYDVAIIAHALAVIKNKRFEGNVDLERIVILALFHDVSEIITGDMPTPIKYYDSIMKSAYRSVEQAAREHLVERLPEDLREEYEKAIFADESETELWRIVKAADKLSALIKCIEEEKSGNYDFVRAKETIEQSLKDMNMPELDCFMNEFLPPFNLTIDELNR